MPNKQLFKLHNSLHKILKNKINHNKLKNSNHLRNNTLNIKN